MQTVAEITRALRRALIARGIAPWALQHRAALPDKEFAEASLADADYRLSTLLALADGLGLDLAFVPRAGTATPDGELLPEPLIKTRVEGIRERLLASSGASHAAALPVPNISLSMTTKSKR